MDTLTGKKEKFKQKIQPTLFCYINRMPNSDCFEAHTPSHFPVIKSNNRSLNHIEMSVSCDLSQGVSWLPR